MSRKKPLQAIDLYSGIGGWSLGLKMAGVVVVKSFELWPAANLTNKNNNGHSDAAADIRELALKDLPRDIDIIVGSPPCTQFSFSNRGGNGDIADGLKDVAAFLRIVKLLKPKFWAMENVPRLKDVLERELRARGKLREFLDLKISGEIFNMEEFGLPQRRKRYIAGNFDLNLLKTYSKATATKNLGAVLKSLSAKKPIDPIFGTKLTDADLTDHDIEPFLDAEEVRINRANKQFHPVYNRMPFPDSLERSVRTITATCTRISRESIIVEDTKLRGKYRRLTVRERASLQGFPAQYQFHGKTHGQKLKLIGNAMPPIFAFQIANVMLGVKWSDTLTVGEAIKRWKPSKNSAPRTVPEKAARNFRIDRSFRFSIPSLMLRSGVRFELTNCLLDQSLSWGVAFYFGSSKSIHQIRLNGHTSDRAMKKISASDLHAKVVSETTYLKNYLKDANSIQLQRVWTHRGPSAIQPLDLLDTLSEAGNRLKKILNGNLELSKSIVVQAIKNEFRLNNKELKGVGKLLNNSSTVAAGLIIGAIVNSSVTTAPRWIAARTTATGKH